VTRYLKDGLLVAGIMICALLLGPAPAQAGFGTGTVMSFTGPATATVGQSLTLTATIQAPPGCCGPDGFNVKEGASQVAPPQAFPSNGAVHTLNFAVTPATAGSHTYTLTQVSGFDGFFGAPKAFTVTVAQATTTTTLSSSTATPAPGQSVTFTATVAGASPSGTVTFKDGAATLGTGTLSGGIATFTTAALSPGSHSITAVYGGDTNNAASTSSPSTVTVGQGDSAKLRQMQLLASNVVAQNSGQAISGAVDNAISDGFNDGGSLVTPSGNGLRFNFAADPDQASAASRDSGADAYTRPNSSRADDAFAAIDRTAMATKATGLKTPEPKDWMLWADVRGSGIDRWSSPAGSVPAQLNGSQVNALLGVTRKLTPSFLVGALGGYETFDYTSQDINGRLKGNGWTAGSYLGWKLTPSIRFDAAVAYSGIGYDGTAGTAQGNFDGRRWLVSSGLTGNYQAYGFDIEPSAKVYALWEHQNAYTDTLGTLQGDRNFSTGRASGGVKLSYPLAWTASIALAPYVGLYGDYYFTRDDAAAIVAAGALPLASTPLLDGGSARAIAGLAAKFADGGTVALGGEYGGIGGNFGFWTFRARAAVPF
jgi:hypothetical protein